MFLSICRHVEVLKHVIVEEETLLGYCTACKRDVEVMSAEYIGPIGRKFGLDAYLNKKRLIRYA